MTHHKKKTAPAKARAFAGGLRTINSLDPATNHNHPAACFAALPFFFFRNLRARSQKNSS
jgi:hypothetical protein